MKFAIITHVPHILDENQYLAYAPYVREMNIWIKEVDTVMLLAPKSGSTKTAIDLVYVHENIEFVAMDSFDLLSLKGIFKTIFTIPKICWQLYTSIQKADHIHLRCPGNIGLLGCFIQILFPNTPKTAKYAGNWDSKSKQPLTYKVQRWILGNSLLTRNMKVLVYGEWEGSSKNIKPFFTATYSESDKLPLHNKNLKGRIDFVFVGTLANGKNPLYAIQLVETVLKKGHDVVLKLYGEGAERKNLERYVEQNNLGHIISLEGNQNQQTLEKAYQDSHFVILPSASEGWPKAIAEGMFWGCVPVATAVSCVPLMLDYGERGVLLTMNLEADCRQILTVISSEEDFKAMRTKASDWSRQYTLDVFEEGIKELLFLEVR